MFCSVSYQSFQLALQPSTRTFCLCIDLCGLFRKRERERVLNAGCQCVCVCVDSPLFSVYTVSPFHVNVFLCACLWLALYSNISGKRSVRCSAQNCVTFRGGFTKNRLCHWYCTLFAFCVVLAPGFKELCKSSNAVNAHKITAECNMHRTVPYFFLPLWFVCWHFYQNSLVT